MGKDSPGLFVLRKLILRGEVLCRVQVFQVHGSSKLSPPACLDLFCVFRAYSKRQSLFQLTAFSPPHCPRRERSEGKPGFVLEPHVNK